MLTLGIDTATEIGSVGLSDSAQTIGELTFSARMSQSERLIQAIDRLLELNRIKVEELKLITVSAGPGSFTGLRIGLATGKGLAQALKIPLVGVPTTDTYAAKVDFWDERIAVLLHDRRNLVYSALFLGGEKVGKEQVQEIESLLNEGSLDETLFIGTGAGRYRERLADLGGTVAPDPLNQPSAAIVALLGVAKYERTNEDELYQLEPLYAQRPIAELKLIRGDVM